MIPFDGPIFDEVSLKFRAMGPPLTLFEFLTNPFGFSGPVGNNVFTELAMLPRGSVTAGVLSITSVPNQQQPPQQQPPPATQPQASDDDDDDESAAAPAEPEVVDVAEALHPQPALAVDEQQRRCPLHGIGAERQRDAVRARQVDSDRESQAVLVEEGREHLPPALRLMMFEDAVQADHRHLRRVEVFGHPF